MPRSELSFRDPEAPVRERFREAVERWLAQPLSGSSLAELERATQAFGHAARVSAMGPEHMIRELQQETFRATEHAGGPAGVGMARLVLWAVVGYYDGVPPYGS